MDVKMTVTSQASDEAMTKYARFLVKNHQELPRQGIPIDPFALGIWRSMALETLEILMKRHPDAAGAYIDMLVNMLSDVELVVLLEQVADYIDR